MSTIKIPILTKDNYVYWSAEMKSLFEVFELWDLVTRGYEEPQDEATLTEMQRATYKELVQRDSTATCLIYDRIDEETFEEIMREPNAKKIWDRLEKIFAKKVEEKRVSSVKPIKIEEAVEYFFTEEREVVIECVSVKEQEAETLEENFEAKFDSAEDKETEEVLVINEEGEIEVDAAENNDIEEYETDDDDEEEINFFEEDKVTDVVSVKKIEAEWSSVEEIKSLDESIEADAAEEKETKTDEIEEVEGTECVSVKEIKNLERREGKLGVRCEAAVAEKEAEETSDGEKFEYQAEVSRLMDLIVHSLYSHKEVFLRELVSNASVALDKLRFLSMTDPSLLGDAGNLEIRIKPDPENGTITIMDTGIGMTKEELIDCFGTIAQSGTSKFLKAIKENQDLEADNGLIGQFGVGFYSAFLVAEKVVVSTKSPNSDKQYVWEVVADSSSYVIKEERDPEKLIPRGTLITLYLRPDEKFEFAEPTSIQELVVLETERKKVFLAHESVETEREMNSVNDEVIEKKKWKEKFDYTHRTYFDLYEFG